MKKEAYDYIHRFVDIFADEYCEDPVDFQLFKAETNWQITKCCNDYTYKIIVDEIILNKGKYINKVVIPLLFTCELVTREELLKYLRDNNISIESTDDRYIKIVYRTKKESY